MFELVLRLSELEARQEIEGEIIEEETRKMLMQGEEMDLGEITLGGLNSTGIILETVYRSGVEGMLDREKVIIINKLMELVQRKEGKIEECMRIIEELHSRCYRFASLRDGLHRLRARVFDLLT